MALAISQAARLRPDIQFVQAVSAFERDLSDAERAVLKNYKTQTPPDALTVLQLTTALDDEDCLKSKRRRPLGARLTSLLEFVVKGAAAIDFVVDAVGEPIASTVWGVLKTLLKLAVAHANYFDKLTQLLKEIGRDAPAYQQLGSLFPEAKGLRDALFHYMRIVVELCHHLVLGLKKNFLAHALTPFLSSDAVTSFKEKLSCLGLAISKQAQVASTQLQVREHHEAALHRFRSQAAQARSSQLVRWEERSRILLACSRFNQRVSWERARKKGNTVWLPQTPAFRNWQSQPQGHFLLLGDFGTGKTLVAASVVSALASSSAAPSQAQATANGLVVTSPSSAPVAYVLASSDEAQSLQKRTVIGCVVRQALERVPNDSDLFTHFNDLEMTEAELFDLFVDAFRHMNCLNIVLDGLDECPQFVDIITWFHRAATTLETKHQEPLRTIKIFVTCRSHMLEQIESILSTPSVVRMPKDNPELSEWIHEEILARVADGRLRLGTPSLVDEIEKTLQEKAKGLFLWAALQMDALCTQSTDREILQCPYTLPANLSRAFDACLPNIEPESQSTHYQRRIFEILVAAMEPLKLEALREAASLTPLDHTWTPEQKINDIRRLLARCGPLVTIEEDDQVAIFVHPSVRQHLTGVAPLGVSTGLRIAGVKADMTLGDICVTYLTMPALQLQVSRSETHPEQEARADLARHIPSAVLEQGLASGSATLHLARVLARMRLASSASSASTAGRWESDLDSNDSNSIEEGLGFAFWSYSRQYWPFHTKHFPVTRNHRNVELLLDVLNRNSASLEMPWWTPSGETRHHALARWVLEYEHELILVYFSPLLWECAPILTLTTMLKKTDFMIRFAENWERYQGLPFEIWLYPLIFRQDRTLVKHWLSQIALKARESPTLYPSGRLYTVFRNEMTEYGIRALSDPFLRDTSTAYWDWAPLGLKLNLWEQILPLYEISGWNDPGLRQDYRSLCLDQPRGIQLLSRDGDGPLLGWVLPLPAPLSRGFHPLSYAAAIGRAEILSALLRCSPVVSKSAPREHVRMLCDAVREATCTYLTCDRELTLASNLTTILKKLLEALREVDAREPRLHGRLRDELGWGASAYRCLFMQTSRSRGIEFEVADGTNPAQMPLIQLCQYKITTEDEARKSMGLRTAFRSGALFGRESTRVNPRLLPLRTFEEGSEPKTVTYADEDTIWAQPPVQIQGTPGSDDES